MGHQRKCKDLRNRVFGKSKGEPTVYVNKVTEKYAYEMKSAPNGQLVKDPIPLVMPKVTKVSTGHKRMYRWLKTRGQL